MPTLLVFNDTVQSPNLGCQIVSAALRTTLANHYQGYKIIFVPMGQGTKYISNNIENIKHVEKVMINGEGSLGNTFAKKYPKEIFSVVNFMHKNNIPTFLVNASVQFSNIDKDKWLPYLRKFTHISVREPISYFLLSEISGMANVSLFPDLASAFLHELPTNSRREKITFGYGSIAKYIDINHESVGKYCSVINHFSRQFDVYFVNFPAQRPHSDVERVIRKLSPNVTLFDAGVSQYIDLHTSALLSVTGRHHGLIMSWIAGAPTISFEANMWKTEGDQLLYGPFDHFHMRSMCTRKLIQKIEKFIDCSDKYLRAARMRKEALSEFFDGHVAITKLKKKDLVESGEFRFEGFEKKLRTFDYFNFGDYGFSN